MGLRFPSIFFLSGVLFVGSFSVISGDKDFYNYDDESSEESDSSESSGEKEFSTVPPPNFQVLVARHFGDQCRNSDECIRKDANTFCHPFYKRCACTHLLVKINGKCEDSKTAEMCNQTEQCQRNDRNSMCNKSLKKCECIENYFKMEDKCYKKVPKLGERCRLSANCKANDPSSYCNTLSGVCDCFLGEFNIDGKCQKLDLGRTFKDVKPKCYKDSDCPARISQCSKGKCWCKKENVILKDNKPICINASKFNDKCKIIEECELADVSSHCDPVVGRCKCNLGCEFDGKRCSRKPLVSKVGESCVASIQCKLFDISSSCDSGINKCRCNIGLEFDGHKCISKVLVGPFHFHTVTILELLIISLLVVTVFTTTFWYLQKRRQASNRYKRLCNQSAAGLNVVVK